MQVEFKTLENGWIKRTFLSALKSIFLNPNNLILLLISLIILTSNGFYLMIFLNLFLINANYSYFYKKSNNSNHYIGRHYFSTISRIIKHDSTVQIDLFIVVIISLLLISSLFFNNTANVDDLNNINESSDSNTINTLLYLLITSLFIGFIFFRALLSNIYYYILMKSNLIFDNFNDFDTNKTYFFKHSINEIKKTNKGFFTKMFFMVSIIFILPIFISTAFPNTFTLPLIINFSTFWLFFIVKELIDGKPEEVKVKVFKMANENG